MLPERAEEGISEIWHVTSPPPSSSSTLSSFPLLDPYFIYIIIRKRRS